MNQLRVFKEPNRPPPRYCRQLAGLFEIEFSEFANIGSGRPGPYTVIDLDLSDAAHFTAVKEWLSRKPEGAKVIFCTDKGSHLQDTRAYAIGASGVLHRPIDGRALLAKLWGEVSVMSPGPSSLAIAKSPAVATAVDTLQSIFTSACVGEDLNSTAIQSASTAVVSHVETQGLTAWIDTVRTHHSQIYQHCLLVTGLAVAFGQQLGLSKADRQRLSFAGMLHDIGKARIPLAILEKPGRLDEQEMAVMRKHPQYGLDALATVPDLQAEMLDMVVHHHEFLDGSGYPHGLRAGEISDLVRIITIADVFGALIERRSYKPPLTSDAAYKILLDMGPKLDKDLVREFRFATQVGGAAAA